MTILRGRIIVQIGNAIIADMNGKPKFANGQEDINAQNVTNNCIKQL